MTTRSQLARFAGLASLVTLGAATLLLCLQACGSSSDTDSSGAEAGSGMAGGTSGEVVVLDGGGKVATPPDGVSACPSGICNYQSGQGCSGSTPACIPELDTTKPVAACSPAGTIAVGAACSSLTDCVAGHLCVEGLCRKLCCGGDWTGCDSASEHCIRNLEYSDGKGGTIGTGAMLCYPVNDCDPLEPSSCSASGTSCQIADATGASACLAENTHGAGEACPCKGGFTCVGGQCTRLCRAVEGGGSPSCQSGEGECIHFARDPKGVGECTKE